MLNDDVFYVDNFLEDPDEVRKFALSLRFSRNKTNSWPGVRTRFISDRPQDLKIKSSSDILYKNYYFDFLDLIEKKCKFIDIENFYIETAFHKTQILSNDLDSPLNTGFIHTDLLGPASRNKKTFAGLLYLNKVSNPRSGTSIFKLKSTPDQNIKITDGDNFRLFDTMLENEGDINYNHYNELFDEYAKIYNLSFTKAKHLDKFLYYKNLIDSKFEKVLDIDNVYNRIVFYNSTYFHTLSHFYVNNFEPRLTQVFFTHEL